MESSVTPTHNVFEAVNWTRVGGRATASIIQGQGRSRSGKKRRITRNDHNFNAQRFLDAANWTRWRMWPGASFCERGLIRDGPDQGHVEGNVK